MISEEEWEYYKPFIEEAERDIEEGRVLTEEEFWKLIYQEERSERKYQKSNIIKLHLPKCLKRTSKRYVKA